MIIFRYIILILLIGLFPIQPALAINAEDRDAIEYDTVYHQKTCIPNATLSSTGGSLPDSVPPEYNQLFTAAANRFNTDPAVVVAIFLIENNGPFLPVSAYKFPPPDKQWPVSSASARGPFQFIDSTWAAYGVDADGNGVKDVNNLKDAAYGAANYMAALGAKQPLTNEKVRRAAGGYYGSITQDGYANKTVELYNAFKNGGDRVALNPLSVKLAFTERIPENGGTSYGPQFPRVSDNNALAERIDKYISDKQPNSPLKGLGSDFVEAGIEYNINPALIVALAQYESSFGTAIPTGSFNSFGRTATSSQPNVSSNGRLWYKYPSFKGSIAPQTQYVRDKFVVELKKRTIRDIMFAYAPPAENRTEEYVEFIESVQKELLEGLAVAGSSESDEDCPDPEVNPSEAGANGYNITGPNSMVNFDQTDPKWANRPYGEGKSSIAQSGCGPTSVAMVVSTLTGSRVTPLQIANRYGDRFHVAGGSSWALFGTAAQDYNLKFKDIGTDLDAAAETLKRGGLVIISVDPGYFTGGGHIMVLRKVSSDGGSFFIADPNGRGKRGDSETRAFSRKFLTTEGGLKHLWAYEKQ